MLYAELARQYVVTDLPFPARCRRASGSQSLGGWRTPRTSGRPPTLLHPQASRAPIQSAGD
jgi:hypothetical protein